MKLNSISETFINSEVAYLISKGCKITIVAKYQGENFNTSMSGVDTLTYSEWPEGFNKRVRLLCQILAYLFKQRKSFINEYLIHKRHGILYLLKIFSKASILEKKISGVYDIAHIQYLNLYPEFNIFKKLGLVSCDKNICSIRGYDISRINNKNKFVANKDSYNSCDYYLPVSKYFSNTLRSLGVKEDKIIVKRSGIEIDKFKFEDRSNFNGHLHLVSCGRLVPKKGFDVTILAMKELLNRGYDSINLTIVGEGRLRLELEKLSTSLKINSKIKFLGSLPHDEVISTMANSNIFVLACKTAPDGDQEGIPNVLKEAMALGVPIVSTKHSGIPELIEDGTHGILSEENDVINFVESIEKMIGLSVKEKRKMLESARHKVETDYASKIVNEKLWKVYNSNTFK